MEDDLLSQVSIYLILDAGNRILSQNIGNCNPKSKIRSYAALHYSITPVLQVQYCFKSLLRL
jgi:hypothetical protein